MKSGQRNSTLWSRPGFLARRLHQINVAIFLAEFEPWRLTPNQWGVLTVVRGSPGLSHTDIAAQCGIDRVNVRDILIRLEERGLVKQKRSTEDRRQSSAVITAAGRNTLSTLEPHLLRANEILLSPLTEAEKDVFLTLLRRVVEVNNDLSRAPLADGGGETTENESRSASVGVERPLSGR
jgi:DNA-binding MarR family transcriptional regulator